MRIFLLFILISWQSCAGYRFQKKSNPFAQYSIRSISVPMFYNHSNFSNVSGVFTKEVFQTLLEFKDLQLKTAGEPSDAVLVGIIYSPKNKADSVTPVSSKKVKNAFGEDSIGPNRQDFVVSSVNQIKLRLKVIVIKHPTQEEIEFLQKNIGQNAISSKIIFNDEISLTANYQLKELRGEATKVIATQNRGVEKQRLNDMAKQAATGFKDMILYAF